MADTQQRLAGRVAVVTGGTQGIGQGVVLRFLKEGASVVYCSRNPANDAENARLIAAIPGAAARTRFVAANSGDRAQMIGLVEVAADRFGGVDIVVANAQGIAPMRPSEQKPDADFAMTLATGFYQSLWVAQAAFPHMKARGGGRIVMMSSHWSLRGHPFTADYNSTKGANESLTRTLAHEWGRHGITVNCLVPAADSVVFRRHRETDPENCARIERSIPARRMGDCERDIAAAVVGLVSANGRFITGQTICIDGGTWIAPPYLRDDKPRDIHAGRDQVAVAVT